MSEKTSITVAYGDGIGPEIMDATLKILHAAGAPIEIDVIEIGQKVYLSGYASGIPEEAWASLKRTKVLLKAPITTPQGGGYKSLNVTLRKTLGLYANVRPCKALSPFVPTHFPNMDLVIVRENEEDLYAGIEYRLTDNVFECAKVITRQGCERIVRYAFEYAKKFNRKRVSCLSKDNIMKMTDGLFHSVFNEIAQEYPSIENDHYIVDIGTALVATDPERFDVIVTENLYGDIISDVAAEVVGSVGMAGSANVGQTMAMFEAIHGSAPDIAGKDIANPSGLLNAAIQMLIHIGAPDVAAMIENAWLKTLEDGVHTGDIYSDRFSTKKVGTAAFAAAVIERLGQIPGTFDKVVYVNDNKSNIVCVDKHDAASKEKVLVGVDIYLDNHTLSAEALAEKLSAVQGPLQLKIIINRGMKVWPDKMAETACSDCYRCRFFNVLDDKQLQTKDIIALLSGIDALGLAIIRSQHLFTFDGVLGYTLAQGQ